MKYEVKKEESKSQRVKESKSLQRIPHGAEEHVGNPF